MGPALHVESWTARSVSEQWADRVLACGRSENGSSVKKSSIRKLVIQELFSVAVRRNRGCDAEGQRVCGMIEWNGDVAVAA